MPRLNLFTTIVLWLAIPMAALSIVRGPTLTVNIADGAVVDDVVTVTVKPLSDIGINKVEFSVDDQLRATVMKAPYTYKWDTVDEDEGRHTLILAAYDADGKATAKRVKVEVDNGLSLGVKPHAAKALALFEQADFDAAMLEGRKAYRINMADPDAIRALAAATGGKGDPNRAIDLLENAQKVNNQVIGDPKSFPMVDAASLRLRGIFRIMRAEKQTNAQAAATDLASAYDLCLTGTETALAEARAKHPATDLSAANTLALGDALFAHRDYAEAYTTYAKVSASDRAYATAQNRAALALIAARRLREAEDTLTARASAGGSSRDTAVSRALLASIYLQRHKPDAARRELADGLRIGSPTALLVSAYADLADLNPSRCYEELMQVARRAPLAECQYLGACLFTDTHNDKRAATTLFAALRMDPLDLDAYVMRGLQLATFDPKNGFAQALPLFDIVLKQDPDNVGAMLGRAMALIQFKQYKAADPIIRRLTREQRDSPDVCIVSAAYYAGGTEQGKATDAILMARQLDPEHFKDIVVPLMTEFAPREAHYRRPPLLTPALLALENAPAGAPAIGGDKSLQDGKP